MKKLFLTLAVLVMAICASAQKNQYFWYQGNLMMGNPIAQIDSVTFGNEDADSIMLYLPRTIVKKEIIHDTVIVPFRDTIYLEAPSSSTDYSCDNIIASGTCGSQGDNITWSLCSDSILIFKGHGNMQGYPNFSAPWYSHIEAFHTAIVGEGIVNIGEDMCMNAHKLRRVILPKSLKRIDFLAFHGAYNLQYVTFPDSLEYIGERAFLDCAFKTITIPASVHTIGGGAFQGCTKLESVYTQSATPAGAGYDIFINVTEATIFVPRGSLQAYQNAYGWSEHASQMVEYDYIPKSVEQEQVLHDTIIVHDTIYVKQPCPNDILEGALNGEFSISPTMKVRFSKGNLQYQASTQTWRFAENQYDMIGALNANISATYDGWIDLFGWGTGNNPTNSSTDHSDYSTFVDWGVNAISNGGKEVNIWRTLTNDEWGYLFNTRADASSKYGQATVAGVIGIIVLPDVYEGTAINTDHSAWDNNTISAEAWAAYEAQGAVFLPGAGDRDGTNVYHVGSDGRYWSASLFDKWSGTSLDGYDAYLMYFESTSINPHASHTRYFGQSVRLVR